ncbi:ST3 beta-galactoside alpha-2,3-sialyltransferase 7 [Aplochiton taeniatus]
MVTLKTLSVEDHEDVSPLLPEAESCTNFTLSHRMPEPANFPISRTKNLTLGLVLIVGCYSAILFPVFLPSEKLTETYDKQQATDLWVLLNRSASLLAALCQPGWSPEHLRSLSCSANLQDIPIFLQPNKRSDPWDQYPPLGLKGSEEPLAQVLATLPQHGLPPSMVGQGEGSCRHCVVVGSGGVLNGKHLGSHIDQYDVIIRMNNAPVSGFERDVGFRTTIRLMYPEGAPLYPRDYRNTSLVALVVFKSQDLEWLNSILTKQPLSFWSKLWFWREVVDHIPLSAEKFRLLNPDIMHRTGLALQSYAQLKRKMVPTLGAGAVVMALQFCDQVSLVGFGYDLHHPGARLHYYETLPMDAIKAQVVHDVSTEKLFLRDLVAAGVVMDLTEAL